MANIKNSNELFIKNKKKSKNEKKMKTKRKKFWRKKMTNEQCRVLNDDIVLQTSLFLSK